MAQQSQILLKTYEEQYSKLFWSVKQEKDLFNQEIYLSRIEKLKQYQLKVEFFDF
ncbi:hypothetical protein GKC56_08580 [Neisseriaceae bacterium PsAf]|nr:hypothetical protein [Neisseriaceae bacterium PsAf]